jgi:hypothetical protein
MRGLHGRFSEIGEDGQHAPVVQTIRGQTELAQDVTDVRLDRLGRQPQPLADAPVGEPFGEQRENLTLTAGQLIEPTPSCWATEQQAHEFGVNDGLAAPDAVDR